MKWGQCTARNLDPLSDTQFTASNNHYLIIQCLFDDLLHPDVKLVFSVFVTNADMKFIHQYFEVTELLEGIAKTTRSLMAMPSSDSVAVSLCPCGKIPDPLGVSYNIN